MIDIIEAGKFYLECLNKVRESTLKENILPENTVVDIRADLFFKLILFPPVFF